MVNIIIAGLIVAGGLLFFGRGGFSNFQAFADSIPTLTDKKKGTATVPTLQSGMGSVPIQAGSQRTVRSIEVEPIIRTSVAQKRKFDPASEKPPIQVVFNNPREGGVLATQKGQIVGANLSIQKGQEFGTGQFGLTPDEIAKLRSKDFTDQEKQDIANLTVRFNRKSISSQQVSESPEELVFKKREQEANAKQVLASTGARFVTSGGVRTASGFFIEEKGGLFGKSNFSTGGKTIAEFEEQQRAKGAIRAKQQQNAILNQQRLETGEQIIQTISKSGLNQKQFLLSKGVALRGGDLNPKAIARLREAGLL